MMLPATASALVLLLAPAGAFVAPQVSSTSSSALHAMGLNGEEIRTRGRTGVAPDFSPDDRYGRASAVRIYQDAQQVSRRADGLSTSLNKGPALWTTRRQEQLRRNEGMAAYEAAERGRYASNNYQRRGISSYSYGRPQDLADDRFGRTSAVRIYQDAQSVARRSDGYSSSLNRRSSPTLWVEQQRELMNRNVRLSSPNKKNNMGPLVVGASVAAAVSLFVFSDAMPSPDAKVVAVRAAVSRDVSSSTSYDPLMAKLQQSPSPTAVKQTAISADAAAPVVAAPPAMMKPQEQAVPAMETVQAAAAPKVMQISEPAAVMESSTETLAQTLAEASSYMDTLVSKMEAQAQAPATLLDQPAPATVMAE